jgi:membrane protein YqaA with SNARE-associated domain
VGMVLKGPELPWWLLAVVIAVGQIGGKLLYYYAARGIIQLPKFLHRKTTPEQKGRWSRWMERFRESCSSRPIWTSGVLLLSASASLPPYLATCVVAGWARVPLCTFIITGLVGRFIRFSALAIAPALVAAWI